MLIRSKDLRSQTSMLNMLIDVHGLHMLTYQPETWPVLLHVVHVDVYVHVVYM